MPVFEMPLDELKAYQGTNPRPDDFDQYWDRALDEMRGTDANVDTIREVLDAVLANAAAVQDQIGRFEANIGDGAATSFALSHNLNSLDVTVEVFENATGATVGVEVTRTNANVVTIGASPAPAVDELRVVVKR